MKKLFFFGLIIVPVAVTGLLWILITDGISCLKDSSDVTVTVKKITLREVSLASSTVEVAVRIENRNSVEATLEKIEYDIYIGDRNKWIWLGRGAKSDLEIGAGEVSDFTVSTLIDNSQLVDVIAASFFGAEPDEMKVDGRAWFRVGPVSVEVEFDETDIDPYRPLIENEDTGAESVQSGDAGATGE